MKKLTATVIKPFNEHKKGDTITTSAGIINHLELDGYVSEVRDAGNASPLDVKVTEVMSVEVAEKPKRARHAKPKTE